MERGIWPLARTKQKHVECLGEFLFLPAWAPQSSATTSHWLNSRGQQRARSTVLSLLGINGAGHRMVEHRLGVGGKPEQPELPNSFISLINPKKVGVIIILFQMREFGSRRYSSNSFRNPDEKMVALPLESKSASSRCLNRVSPVNYPENEFGDPLLSIETGGRVFPT